MTVETRAIKPEERDECLNLWCTVWPAAGSRKFFHRYFYNDVEWLPYYTQVTLVDGRIVSAVQIVKRTVACRDFQLTMGGIANVATHPDHRGKGYNIACLKRAIQVMESDAMDFSLLFTGIHGYYARLGFDTLEATSLVVEVPRDFEPGESGFGVRPGSSSDLSAIAALYEEYNDNRAIAVERTDGYWRDWIGMDAAKLASTVLVAAPEGSHPAGYLCYEKRPDGIKITEIAVSKAAGGLTAAAATTALIRAAAGVASGREGVRLILSVALEHDVLDAARTVDPEAQIHTDPHGMARLLHHDSLLRSFTMSWTESWRLAGSPRGILSFATPYGAVTIDANSTFLKISSQAGASAPFSQAALFHLLFGVIEPERATQDTALHPLLKSLFPRGAPIYWSADGF